MSSLNHRLCVWLVLLMGCVSSLWLPDSFALAQAGPGADAIFNREVRRAMHLKQAGEHDRALSAFDRALEAIKAVSGESYDKGRARVRYHKAIVLIAIERYRDAELLLRIVLQSPGLIDVDRSVVVERLSFAERAALEADKASSAEAARALVEQQEMARREVTAAWAQRQAHKDNPALEAIAWSTSVAGVATLIGAGVMHGLGAADWREADVAGQPYLEAKATADRGAKRLNVAYALYGVGSALAVTAVILWVVSQPSEEPGDGTDVSVYVVPWRDGGYALGTLRF